MIVHFLYEPGDGGLDRVAILLANAMGKRGLPVELWMVKAQGPISTLINHDHVNVRIIATASFGGRGFRLFCAIPALAKMIRKHRPEFLLSAGNQSNLVIALANKFVRASVTRIVQKITNPIRHPEMSAAMVAVRRKRFEMTARAGDMCMVLSEADAKAYNMLLPKAFGKFRAVCNTYVTEEMLVTGRARTPRDHAAPARLLAVGRLAKQKNYEMMLRVLTRLPDISWRLTILGDGPLSDQMKIMASELGIADHIDFAGFVENPAPYYAQSDLLLLSSRWEGFPAVPLEALASGCDIVATDCAGGLNDILHDLGSEPIPIDDDEAFAEAITEKIKRPSNAQQMIKIAAKYSIEASVDDHLRLLDDCKSSAG